MEKKVRKGLSAGRVQSIALKLICDREKEINAFIPEEYWTIDAQILSNETKDTFTAKFYGTKDGKLELHNEEEVKKKFLMSLKMLTLRLQRSKNVIVKRNHHFHLRQVHCNKMLPKKTEFYRNQNHENCSAII